MKLSNKSDFQFIYFRLNIFFGQSGNEQEWGSLLKPFKKETWLALFAWLLVGAIAFSLLYSLAALYDIENYTYRHEFTIIGSFFVVFRAFVNQGLYFGKFSYI